MDQNRQQSNARTKNECGPITRPCSEVALLPTNESPRLEQSREKQNPGSSHQAGPDQPPICQSIEIVVVGVARAGMNKPGTVTGKAIIIMSRTNSQPKMLLPHLDC